MSKRLAISSLLCDDDDAVRLPSSTTEPQIVPEPVVLAPHLRKSPQRLDTDSHSRNQYLPSTSNVTTRPTTSVAASPSLASSPTSSRLGLDALVHAASEERRRLSVSGPPNTKGSSYQPPALASRNPAEDTFPQFHPQRSPNLSPLHELKLRTTNPISPLLTQQQQQPQRRTIPLDDGGPVHLSPVEDLSRRAGPSRSPYTFPSPLPPSSYRPSSSHSSPSIHSPSYHHLSPATDHPRERSRDREREQIREREAHDQELLQYQQRHHRQQQQLMLMQQEQQRHVHRDRILGYGSTGAAPRVDADRSAHSPLDHRDRHGRKSDPLPGPGMRTILSPTTERTPSSLSGPGMASSSTYTNYMPLPTPTRSSPHLQPVHQSSHTSRSLISPSFPHADLSFDREDERTSKKRRHSDASPVRNEETNPSERTMGIGEQLEREKGRAAERNISGDWDNPYGRDRMRERYEMERLLRERDREELERARHEQEREARRGVGGTGYSGPSLNTITNARPTSIAAITSPSIPSIPAITSPTTRRAGAGYDPVHDLDQVRPPHSQENVQKRSHEIADISRDGQDNQKFSGTAPIPSHERNETSLEQQEIAALTRTEDYPQQQPSRTAQTFFHHRVNDRDPVHSAHRDSQAFLQLQMQAETFRRPPHHVEQEQHQESPHVPRIPHQPSVQHQHRVVSPNSIGRRSPPGSQVGRAIAARKVELEHQQQHLSIVVESSPNAVKIEKRDGILPSTSPSMGRSTALMPPSASGQPLQSPPKGPEEKPKSELLERKRTRTIALDDVAEVASGAPIVDGSTPILAESSSSQQHSQPSDSIPVPTSHSTHPVILQTKPVHQRAPTQAQVQLNEDEDAHEWFLEHYADDTSEARPPITQSQPPPSTSNRPRESKADPVRMGTKSPISKKHIPRTPTPVTHPSPATEDNDAVMALEQELELGLAEVSAEYQKKKESSANAMDVDEADVDQAVAVLVEDALGTGPEENEDGESEIDKDENTVDVEDELLSLLDDRPQHHSTNNVPKHHPHTSNSQSSSSSGRRSSKPSKPKHAVKHSPPRPPALKLKDESGSQPASPLTGPLVRSATRSPSVGLGTSATRASSLRPHEKDDRESMPPPATPNKEQVEVVASAAQPKKKGKPGPKPKPRNSDNAVVGAPPHVPPKPRNKPGPKPKPRDEFGNIIRAHAAPPASAKAGKGASTTPAPQTTKSTSSLGVVSGSGARSRSTSVLPGGSAGPEGDASAKGDEEKEVDDDKLYCVCKTHYDEDRAMIACDACDEWYHTQCMDVQDHLVDLVDQFFCPLCVEKHPTQSFQTTYKPRCLYGLDFPDPDSPKACHKPARPFSKYCSDECGVKNLRKRIDVFTKKGGKKDDLWETVKDATAREGIVKCVEEVDPMDTDDGGVVCVKTVMKEVKPAKSKKDRELERLHSLLGGIEKLREELKRDMDIVLWREKLLQLASDRAETVGQCGWDQRLCFSDEDYADYGEGVLESYAELEEDEMNADGEGEWWCPGEQECERHAGWQGLRTKDVDKEKEKKEEALTKLTRKEREIRKRIDSMMEDADGGRINAAPADPPKPSNKLTNGHHAKGKVNGDIAKKGKKRKAPS